MKLCLRLSSGAIPDLASLPVQNQCLCLSAVLPWRQGVLALHSHKPPILHRDLKSPNLLIDKHWRCKIADFNLSRVMVRAAARSRARRQALSTRPRPMARAGLPPASQMSRAADWACSMCSLSGPSWAYPGRARRPSAAHAARRGGR
jgi:serine/threonine protein kinase